MRASQKKINPKEEIAITSEIISHESKKFAQIMELDDINQQDIMDSLQVNENVNSVF